MRQYFPIHVICLFRFLSVLASPSRLLAPHRIRYARLERFRKLNEQIELNGIVSWNRTMVYDATVHSPIVWSCIDKFGVSLKRKILQRSNCFCWLCCRFWFAPAERKMRLIQSTLTQWCNSQSTTNGMRKWQVAIQLIVIGGCARAMRELDVNEVHFLPIFIKMSFIHSLRLLCSVAFFFALSVPSFPLFRTYLTLTYTLCHCEFDDLTRELSWNDSIRIESNQMTSTKVTSTRKWEKYYTHTH